MPSKLLRVFALIAVTSALALSASAEEKKAEHKAAKASGKAVFKPADQMKWTAMPDAPAGITSVVLWGNPGKGPSGALHKFPAGFSVPLHHHTADHRIVVLSGTMIFTPEGGSATRLPAGSYAYFTGKVKHTTACDAASECEVLVDAHGAWDVVPEEPKK